MGREGSEGKGKNRGTWWKRERSGKGFRGVMVGLSVGDLHYGEEKKRNYYYY